jgi:transcriptional antiterminator RfaH
MDWFVVHTKPKQEERADANLRMWGIETLMPKLRELRPARRSGVVRYWVTPLFPGYLFARFDATHLFDKVKLTRGVHSIVGFGEHATPVDESIIRSVRSRIGEDGFVYMADPRPGDKVEIIGGPLNSFSGVFERSLGARDRVLILLTTLGLGARVQVHRAFVRRIESAQLP